MSDKVQLQCPKCGGGEMWDNRLTKKNPKAPDFKCVDKSCDGVVWPPKPGAAPAPAPRAVAPVAASPKQAFTAGPPIAGLDTETGAPPAAAPDKITRLTAMFALYDVCLDHAHAAAVRKFGADVTDEAVAAMCATLFIEASH